MANSDLTLLKTSDGTYTAYLEEYKEAMHSNSGAYEEAVLKHIYPSNILDIAEDPLEVLDVGFGLGYNILALITELNIRKKCKNVKIYSLEKNRSFKDALDEIIFYDIRDKYYSYIKTAYNDGIFQCDNILIKIIFGDGRITVKELNNKHFHAIFFDPFSPSKNPELWTVDFFKIIYDRLHEHGILTTYSSAFQIRMALLEAGFIIGRGPSVGGKKEGTIAARNKLIKPLHNNETDMIKNDIRSVPYRDNSLNLNRPSILKNRIEKMKEIKQKSSKNN